MKRLAGIVLALLALTARGADDAKDKAVNAEREKLQGEWRMVRINDSGTEKALGQGVAHKVTVAGDTWADERTSPFKLEGWRDELAFRIDPTKSPKELDIVSRGADGKDRVERCIYTLDEGTLTICSPSRGRGTDSKERPKEFKAPQGGTVRVFNRAEK